MRYAAFQIWRVSALCIFRRKFMLLEALIKSEWSQVVNWGKMRASKYQPAYTEADFDNFVEITFRDVAEELGIKYDLIKDILYGKNAQFLEIKARYFADCEDLSPDEDEYEELTSSLMIPCVYHLKKVNTVDAFFEYFEKLCLKDKVEVIERLMKVEINASNFSRTDMLAAFERLSVSQKCEAIKSILGINISIDTDI